MNKNRINSTQGTRFHLNPLSERASYNDLLAREKSYLLSNRISNPGIPSPNSQLKLVVVIPMFNEKEYIGGVLQSLSTQDLPAEQMEVLVIDNGSTDGSANKVLQFVNSRAVPIYLLSDQRCGCLQAVRTGLDMGLLRLSQVAPPMKGLLAVVDADDCVGPRWASTFLEIENDSKADMIRGKTQIHLSSLVERNMKLLCDLENRVFAYAELARLRIYEAVNAKREQNLPLWLPRITGPNIVVTRAAYVSVGGLDPRPPGDQASHLANPLLRLGGNFFLCNDERLTLYRSSRESQRCINQAAGFGVGFGIGFGDMISRASASAHNKSKLEYPNPTWMEYGLHTVLSELKSEISGRKQKAEEFAKKFLESPTDPSALYHYGHLAKGSDITSIEDAKARLVEMTRRAGGIDYRVAEWFLMAKEHLRQSVLSYNSANVNSLCVTNKLLELMGFPLESLPPHVEKLIEILRILPGDEKSRWFDLACRSLEETYARIHINEINNSTVEAK